MANIDDLVTVQKNGVVAINALQQSLAAFLAAYQSVAGSLTYLGITNDSLVLQGSGRICRIVVSVAGAAGTIHDAATVAEATASNVIGVIPAAAGTVEIGMPFVDGLVVKPGTGQTLSICYSEDPDT